MGLEEREGRRGEKREEERKKMEERGKMKGLQFQFRHDLTKIHRLLTR